MAAVNGTDMAKNIHREARETVKSPVGPVEKNCIPNRVCEPLSQQQRLDTVVGRSLTAMNCPGRNNRVTIVITRIVPESCTTLSFRARVFLLIFCAVCWFFIFNVSDSIWAVARIFCSMKVAFCRYAAAALS